MKTLATCVLHRSTVHTSPVCPLCSIAAFELRRMEPTRLPRRAVVNPGATQVCQWCKRAFHPYNDQQRMCSPQCARKGQRFRERSRP